MQDIDLSTYNSKDTRFKSPFGAVTSGTKVTFSLRPARREGVKRVVLQARFERLDMETTLEMPWVCLELDRDVFSVVLETNEYIGLVWYQFTLEHFDGSSRSLGTYQLTVYDGKIDVPSWFGEGVSYQIFPDRFRRTRIPDPSGMVGGRWIHAAWQEDPEYRPDFRGEIRNRDFFGGNLEGVIEKLDYLKDLGIQTIYFCPIFEAAENHRYGTADYHKIDPMLGTEEDFKRLCDEAHQRGMRVMLDGVFNHVGFVSRYFNGDGFYPDVGAYQSKDSPYFKWFNFSHWPNQYESWWGVYSLPSITEDEPSYRRFIFDSEDSVVRRWLRAGADGWRLDVADELPDRFISGMHAAARAEKPDAVMIGEVWEDGSTKVAYGVRRKHILGGHCDGLMNYPFRNACIEYFRGGDAHNFVENMETLRENYPHFAYYSAMNVLGTHDTPRILTVLEPGEWPGDKSREWRCIYRMNRKNRKIARERLMAAAALLFAFPGSPTVYYGDEAGMEGYEDPFNRRTYPWGEEDKGLLEWYRKLGQARVRYECLRKGDIHYLVGMGHVLCFTRSWESETMLCAFNAGPHEEYLPLEGKREPERVLGPATVEHDGGLGLTLPPRSGSYFQL